MAIQLLPEERDIPRIVQAVRELVEGRGNNVGTFTLAASVTSTSVNWVNCSRDSRIFITPETSDAAAAVPTTYIDPDDISQGGFIVRHASTVSTDRKFSFLCIGG